MDSLYRRLWLLFYILPINYLQVLYNMFNRLFYHYNSRLFSSKSNERYFHGHDSIVFLMEFHYRVMAYNFIKYLLLIVLIKSIISNMNIPQLLNNEDIVFSV